MTNGECIYRKTVDYMSRMALEKDDFRRFSVIWEFCVTGNWVAARVASRLEIGPFKARAMFAPRSRGVKKTLRSLLKAVTHTPNFTMSHHFPDFSLVCFRQLKVNFRKKRAGEQKQKNHAKVFKHTKRRNLRDYNLRRDENHQKGNEMDRPSLRVFTLSQIASLRKLIKIKHG